MEQYNKFIQFSLDANEKTFKEIFGMDGSVIYHNVYFAQFGKNMPKFINSLKNDDKVKIYNYINKA